MATIEVCDRCEYPKRDKRARSFKADIEGEPSTTINALLCDKCFDAAIRALSARCSPPAKRKGADGQ